MNTQLLQKAGEALDQALDNGEIEAKDLPKTYAILADKQAKLEGWDGRKIEGEGSFLHNLAKTLNAGGKLTVEVEPVEIVNVTPQAIGAPHPPPPPKLPR